MKIRQDPLDRGKAVKIPVRSLHNYGLLVLEALIGG